jgi:signal transduction histidine kinase
MRIRKGHERLAGRALELGARASWIIPTEKIVIDMQLYPELPPVIGNANYLQQVFLNLAINARDAMPNGGTLSVSSKHDHQNVIIRMADTGVGIGTEHLERIFQPFFTTKGEGKGTGLGLAISRKIISQHQGRINVESEPGKGTAFTISLPVRRAGKQ